MHVIGTSESEFVKIGFGTYMSANEMHFEVEIVRYNSEKYTLFPSYEKAKSALEDIKKRKGEIEFINDSVIGAILDKDKVFDPNELKIYELVAVEVKNKE